MFKTLLCQPTWFQMYVWYTIWKCVHMLCYTIDFKFFWNGKTQIPLLKLSWSFLGSKFVWLYPQNKLLVTYRLARAKMGILAELVAMLITEFCKKNYIWLFFLCLQQFNQLRQAQPQNLYKQMPQLRFGPGGGRGQAARANFSKPFIPNQPGQVNHRQQMNLPQFGQVGRLAGNPSVTIQVSQLKNGSNLAHLNFSLSYLIVKKIFSERNLWFYSALKVYLISQLESLTPNIRDN